MKRLATESRFGTAKPFHPRPMSPARLRTRGHKWPAARLSAGIVLAAWAPAWAQTFNLVYSFPSYAPPGWFAQPLVLGNAVYGLSSGTYGSGSIFRVNVDGTGFTTVKNFPATSEGTNSDGAG